LLFFLNTILIQENFQYTTKNAFLKQNPSNASKYLTLSDVYGDIFIYNITFNKPIVEIGENITISTVYSFLCNEEFKRGYGWIGIENSVWYEYKNTLIDGVSFYNCSETISINPTHFNSLDLCKGRVELKVIKILDPLNYTIYSNTSINSFLVTKAQLNYSIIHQFPLTVFSSDLLNFSFKIYNEHTENYVLSNESVRIYVQNENKSLNMTQKTDFNGLLNFTINCSILGPGIYSIHLENNKTNDYEVTPYDFQVNVLNESSSINCTLLNEHAIYSNVKYDDSNYSKAFFILQTEFDANVTYQSDFSSGQGSGIGRIHLISIPSPPKAGLYNITFKVYPLIIGRKIEFNTTLEIRKRPIDIDISFFRKENQSKLFFQINITDILVNQSAQTNNTLNILAIYNNTSKKIGDIKFNSNGSHLFQWDIPSYIREDFITFYFLFNSTFVYQEKLILKNLTITKIQYLGPLQAYLLQNISFSVKLFTLNGTNLPNRQISIKLGNSILNLTTSANGKIFYSIIAPNFATNLRIDFIFFGNEQILSSSLVIIIKIQLNFVQQLWNSFGFILLGISMAALSILYLRRKFLNRRLTSMKVK